MPRLRLLVALAGRDMSFSAGDFYDCDETSAARLVAAGYAERIEPVRHEPMRVAVADPAPERAVTRGRRQK